MTNNTKVAIEYFLSGGISERNEPLNDAEFKDYNDVIKRINLLKQAVPQLDRIITNINILEKFLSDNIDEVAKNLWEEAFNYNNYEYVDDDLRARLREFRAKYKSKDDKNLKEMLEFTLQKIKVSENGITYDNDDVFDRLK